MSDPRSAPLTSPGCDLTDFAFMPLDVARLRDSELASNETPEACWAAVLLWAASWHQVPAASVPNDDKWLAKAAGYGRVLKEWLRVKEGAMRGFVECADGRLYHAVVAEKAREAWQAKLEQRWRTECARIKKHNDRHGTEVAKPPFDEWLAAGCPVGQTLPVPRDKPPRPSAVPGETASKGQGEGQGQGDSSNTSEAIASGGAAAADQPMPPPAPLPPAPVPPPAAAPPSDRDMVFALGVPLLTAAGVKESNARSFLAAQSKAHGDAALVSALERCAIDRPVQPVPWLQQTLKPKASRHTGFASKDYREGVEADGSFA